jgi:hypothetical protein
VRNFQQHAFLINLNLPDITSKFGMIAFCVVYIPHLWALYFIYTIYLIQGSTCLVPKPTNRKLNIDFCRRPRRFTFQKNILKEGCVSFEAVLPCYNSGPYSKWHWCLPPPPPKKSFGVMLVKKLFGVMLVTLTENHQTRPEAVLCEVQ